MPELPPHRDGVDGVLPGALSAVRPTPARKIGATIPRGGRKGGDGAKVDENGEERSTREEGRKLARQNSEFERELWFKMMINFSLSTFHRRIDRRTDGHTDVRTERRQGHFCRVAVAARPS